MAIMAGIDALHFSGHSFRIGTASVAAARGVADSTIQSLGRWKSDSFERYIRRAELAAISVMVNVDLSHDTSLLLDSGGPSS